MDGTTCTPSTSFSRCTLVVIFLTTLSLSGCKTNLGYTLSGTSPADYKCTALTTDPSNCGSVGNACPPSYNGIGFAICLGGCNLRTFSYFTYIKCDESLITIYLPFNRMPYRLLSIRVRRFFFQLFHFFPLLVKLTLILSCRTDSGHYYCA